MFPKRATRVINNSKLRIEESTSVTIQVPEFLQNWILTDDGVKLCKKCKERKELSDCYVEDDGENLNLRRS